jgi:hypothetical protein
MLKIFGWVAAGVMALSVVGIAGTYLSTAANVATTPARALNEVVRTENVLSSYEAFYGYRQRFQTRVADIQNWTTQNASETDAAQIRVNNTNILAMRSACRDLANKYNADAENLTSAWFRDGRLPQTLNVEECNS